MCMCYMLSACLMLTAQIVIASCLSPQSATSDRTVDVLLLVPVQLLLLLLNGRRPGDPAKIRTTRE